MKLMTLQQYTKMSKPALIRKITKALNRLPKRKLAKLCYEISKAKLTEIKITPSGSGYKWLKKTPSGRMSVGYDFRKDITPSRVGKRDVVQRKRRKFSKKQLAAQRLFAKRAKAGTLKRRRR